MKNNYKIAIVDDEPKIVRFIKANLLSFNYQVCTFSNGEQFLEQFDLHEPDLVLLDVMMPDMDGFTVLKQLRKFSKVPVIFLTARSASDDMLQAFDLEADDYLTKPFSLDELFARVKAVLRRTKVNYELGREESRITTFNLEINIAQKRVYVKGNEVKLTNIEYLILELLGMHMDKIISHEQILTTVWGPDYSNEIEYLRVAVARVRKKLKQAGCDHYQEVIKTYSGIGYSLISSKGDYESENKPASEENPPLED
ncbi:MULTISPECIES: response regulator transcription factor [unclassified Paenibacillus]|uniref:response regulator transcription factor n=1 Tax=unclassified Paenibacillus TaxID=185978 RepID=UPI000840B60E|nr:MULTISPECIES: response regulator transcription factor [unclassified Paenibacillus]NWL90284.1 DNA-binding response regulator [Paenibacillus sp. 79R4]